MSLTMYHARTNESQETTKLSCRNDLHQTTPSVNIVSSCNGKSQSIARVITNHRVKLPHQEPQQFKGSCQAGTGRATTVQG
eukprot:4075039-Amphidinium_carterae.3